MVRNIAVTTEIWSPRARRMGRPRIFKNAKPPTGSSPRRWAKYVARNPPLVKTVREPEKYLNASRRAL